MTIPTRILLLIALTLFPLEVNSDYGPFASSYVFLSASNKRTGDRVEMCVNYQQYRLKTSVIGKNLESAPSFTLQWWKQAPNVTKICPLPTSKHSYNGNIVPIEYRIDDDGTACTRPFTTTSTAFRNASSFSDGVLEKSNASASLFILDRGRQFVQGWKDYLFSEFYDPYINSSTAIPTFFIYRKVFNDKIESIIRESDVADENIELKFYRPEGRTFDFSMNIIWIIAMICVAGGGLWAFHRQRLGKDIAVAEATAPVQHNENEKVGFMAKHGNIVGIVLLMAILITVIMLGYYFRSFLVFFFNILLVIFGTSSIHGCARALLSNFPFSKHNWYTAKIKCIPLIFGQKEHFSYTGAISVTISFCFCLCWYLFRLHPYAFIPLDFINTTLCLHILKSLRLPSLKWISILMVCMFVYDAIMVFATPMWTKNGCSIMLEVATGMDCSVGKANSSGYPLPPVEVDSVPERFPMLMQVMHFDPMIDCIDLEVERGYQMTILGLGDIIIPGYLVAHSFTMNGFTDKVRLIYGFTCIIGYGVGLIVTFIALVSMKIAQPALIYLVPFTLIPIITIALIRGEFCKVWNGVPYDKAILVEEESADASKRTEDEQNESNESSQAMVSVQIENNSDPPTAV